MLKVRKSMSNTKKLFEEMKKLKMQIETVLCVSDYRNCNDLSGLEDFKQIRTADERQQLEEYCSILDKLDDIQSSLAYLDRPIREVSQLHINESGRYETDKGYYYTSGSCIEFLRDDEVYDSDNDAFENAEIWTISRVESQKGQYYIVGYSNIKMSGLTVRVRE